MISPRMKSNLFLDVRDGVMNMLRNFRITNNGKLLTSKVMVIASIELYAYVLDIKRIIIKR